MFFEGIAYLSHPQTSNIFDLINNNEIGEIISKSLSLVLE